ncbi:retention module-containing protein [Pseudomonas xantholysinigenes]|uniref:Retention module-containing protein n=1 Tax=Pseudomonas xantholysinigenes TaxID=2745490 RepID=A0A9E6TWP8_9PSED|nr:retention module-containing protein [Pseudomonas xantholysinigenes]QXI37165.1 retention module-containing protein [Pseudomonas xantholysinigenes]
MAKLVGVVSKVVGQVFAVGDDGHRRLLVEGDRLFAGEQLQTSSAGAVAVRLHNGAELTLGRDSSLEMTPELLANRAPHVQTPDLVPNDGQLSDVERIQQAIAAGADPTQEAEATAAGGNPAGVAGALGGGHSFVILSEVAGRVDPTIGFPTAGFNGIPELANRYLGALDLNNDNGLPPGADNPVSLDGLAVSPGELTLDEANLPQGSASNPAALTQAGSFTVVAADGVFNLSVGGINVVTAGVVTGVGQSIVTGLGNILTITGYNPTTGVVSYSYTLTGAEQHPDGAGNNTLGEHFPVLVSDSDGDVASGSLDVIIRDDVPRAVNDGNAVTATEQHLELTGNVLTNDVQGADRIASGPVVAGTFVGTYGTLVLAADGSYTYTLNPDDTDFKNLHGGGNGVETFTYTLKDSDGDTSTATLTLNVSNLNDPVTLGGLGVNGGGLTVYEKNLADGSAPNPGALTQSGSFTVTAPDGLQTLSVGGITVVSGGVAAGFPQSITTALGNTLTITGYNPATGVVSYSYTLTATETHASGDGANSLSEHFTVTATDTDGSSASSTLDVNIVDDVPKAVDDSNATPATEQHLELTGNVLTNDVQGADRVASGPVVAGTFVGTYGTLVLAADGSYTYTLNPNDTDFKNLHGGGNGVETFTYTLKDADGDTSTATLTLNVTNLNDPVTLGGLDVNGGELTVYEKNLADGSAPNPGALTQSGSFTVTAPDGLQTLSVGGISVVSGGVAAGFPQSITTALGNTLTITGYNPATGVVSYSYTLATTETHASGDGANSLSEHFTVTATDTDGSSASNTLDVNIVDDVPKAVDDSNATPATEQHLELTGNVLTNDVQGADRVASGPVVAGTFVGTYGTLVLAADGSYTYTLNPNDTDFKNLHGGGNGVENFTYTLKDADGDTSTATLTLNVTNLNDPVTLGGLDVNGGELTVYEKNLADGSAPNPGALTQSGSFTVTAPDGLQTLSVGGITVVSGGVAAGFPQSITTALGNTLTITGYNPTTGVVSYSYTLATTETHASGDGANSLSEHFTVTATDTDGSSASNTLDVNIVDDVPKAVDDSNATPATEQHLELTGNVLTNDVQGADRVASGPVVAGTFVGTYGTLVLAADGSYTYTLNPNDTDFKNLHGGGNGVENFTYTLKDADGDTSTATLTLNVTNLNDPVTLGGLDVNGGELTVYEKNLADGSAPNPGALTQSGSFTVTAPDGLQTLSVGGITVVSGGVAAGFPQSITTALGNTLTITGYNPTTGVVSYSYTLATTETHASGDGANSLSEHFTVTATDTDGSSASSTLDVNIVDDVPKAVDDSNATPATEQHLELTGNVLGNDVQGADRVASGPVVAGTFVGTYGTLVLAADGSYTYTLNPNDTDFKNLHGGGNGVETFTYTLKDADGDTSTATLTLNVTNLNDPVTLGGLDVNGGELTVYEKNLADGSAPNPGALTQSGSFTVTAPDGLQTLSVGGISVVSGGVAVGFPQSITTALGNTLTITGYNPATGVVSYSYTLTTTETHASGDGANSLSEHFTVTATDTDGSSASNTLDVNIIDDLPKAEADAASVVEGGTVSGNVLDNDSSGADVRADGQYVVGVRAGADTSTSAIGQLGSNVVGQYGYLTLDAQGNATYHANPNAVAPPGATDVFVYTVRDADGDESTTTITIDVRDCSLIAGPDSEVTVYEKALDLNKDGNDLAGGTVVGSEPGSSAETASGSLAGSASGGVGALTYSLVGSATGQYGQIQLNADGTYTYTLTSPANSPNHVNDGPNVLTETFTYEVKDSLGNATTSTIVISIVDDVPKAHSDFANVYEGGTVSGNVLVNDVVGADVRADGQYVVGVRAGTDTSTSAIGQLGSHVVGQYGYLTLDAQGNASYHANPDSVAPPGATDVFVYTIRDADGDESTTTITIDVHDISLVVCPDDSVKVFEKALDLVKDGSDLAPGTVTGSDPHATSETTSGSLASSVSGGIGALTFTLVSNALGQYGQIQLNADGSYTYTLTSAPNSPVHANDGPNVVTESFTYQVKDSLGNSTTSTLVVSIVDDMPKAHCDVISVAEGSTVSGNVLDNDVIGADVRSDGQYVVGVRAGSDTATSASGHVGEQIVGQYGYLTLDSQGNAIYHANPDSVAPAGAADVFVYTIRDADGDESTTTLTINVQDSKLVAAVDNDVTVYEKALDLFKDGNDLAAGTVTGSEPGSSSETASGSLVGSVTGGVGALTYSLVGNAVGQYGQIQLNADGSYTYTLTSAPKTPGGADDGANTVNEYFTYKATDALGNSVTSTIAINIVDDVPNVASAVRSITPGQVDSNILLVIDVSGSMDSASGVPGLTRLDLAKQAINALLDKYDEMGDIKVQVVTFSTGATVQTPVWVTISEAKSLIAGLTANGSTYYDSAATKAQEAWSTSGKLVGAQNISYFFSDGEPTSGHSMTAVRETAWETFLDNNGIKSYAIGMGTGVNAGNLNPLAYDGSSHTDTNSVVVTDLNQLNAVLTGTVQGAPITGSLMSGGDFGADGGFIKALLVDGTTYTYDPKANGGQGGYTVSGGADKAMFDTGTNSLNIKTSLGGTLLVNMDNGEFTYTPPKDNGSSQVEHFTFTASDNDGDTRSATLTVNINTNTAPVAGADHIISNISGATLTVPAEALLANDSDADHDRLSAAPITFNTNFADKGAGFTAGAQARTISFDGTQNRSENQFRDLARSEFTSLNGSMTAALVVAGYLGSISTSNANDEDTLTVTLRKGETLTLDHDRPAGNLMMEWKDASGSYQTIADGGSFTASHDGVYSIHVINTENAAGNSKAAENYKLSLVVDYSNATNDPYHGSYTVSDNHGGTATGAVDITYQAGNTLTGTSGDDVLVAGNGDTTLNGGAGNDVLVAGAGNNSLHGGDGNDLLIGGPGNDLLDGGAGNDTASYARATAGVTVDLGHVGPQNTVGAGQDTLTGIENLIGSDYNDTLIGNDGDNLLNGGAGNDVLRGGAGNDILIGGRGDDTLTGGSGNDVFVWQKGDTGHDTVTDFTPGSDRLDLSQLLQGENATSASLDDYLHFKVSGTGGNVVSTIEVSSVAGAAPTQTIDLAGVDLAQHYGVAAGAGGVIAAGHDTATIINGMLNDHSLKVDTV